jgi:hypothetical protein
MTRPDTVRDRSRHISHLILDRIESLVAAMPQARAHPHDPVAHRIARAKCNLMALWRLCDQANCRRAQRCRGEPHGCLRRHVPQVPREVAAGAEALIACARKRRSPAALRPWARRRIAALADWSGRAG